MDCVPHCVSFGIGDRNCVALCDTAEGRCVMKFYKVYARNSTIGYGYVYAKDEKDAENIFWEYEDSVDWQEGNIETEEVVEVTDLKSIQRDCLNFDEDEIDSLPLKSFVKGEAVNTEKEGA